MSHTVHSNVVYANRAILAGDALTSAAIGTTKTYFASKRTIDPNTAPIDAVWNAKIIGSLSTSLLSASVMLRLELNRTPVIALAYAFLPGVSLAKQQWRLDIDITKGAAPGSVLINGMAGMSLALGGAITWQPMMGGLVTGIDWTASNDFEVSLQYGALGTGSTMTLEQHMWVEHRGI